MAKRTSKLTQVDANQLEFAKPLEYRLERGGQTVTQLASTSFCKLVKHVVMLCMDAIIIIVIVIVVVVVVVVVCNRPVCAINKRDAHPYCVVVSEWILIWVDTFSWFTAE